MSLKLKYASAISVVATFVTALVSTGGSGAVAQVYEAPAAVSAAIAEPAATFTGEPVVQPLPQEEEGPVANDRAGSLAELVDETPVPAEVTREMNCLAGAIYFEAKGESLAGQLAVGRVIVARSKSGRFPASYCGVVLQRSQFSFVRGNAIPWINHASQDWQDAVRIAQIADTGSWKSPVEGALFFHAARVSPGWRLTRLARIDGHVFYR